MSEPPNEKPDCRCPMPNPTGRGTCGECGRFACEYADRGRTRCSPSICDCFIETYPDSPRDLHPEAFLVVDARRSSEVANGLAAAEPRRNG